MYFIAIRVFRNCGCGPTLVVSSFLAFLYREYPEQQFLGDKIMALIATKIPGMGYDKSTPGFVVYYQGPGSKVGRAMDHAVCVLMVCKVDQHVNGYFKTTTPPKDRRVIKILETLEESDGMSIRQPEATINLKHGQIRQILKFFPVENPAPVIKSGVPGLALRTCCLWFRGMICI